MRFLLVNPFYPIDENPSPPLGLAFLAAALERAGVDVRVLDLVVNPYGREWLADYLSEYQPDIVGATSVTMSFDSAMAVLEDVKGINPEIRTVMGGPHVSFRAVESMKEFPALDFIIQGEGEESVVELTAAVARGSGFEDILGLVFRRDGGIVCTETRLPGIDVNSLPVPARHLLPLGRYRTLGMAISMTTSRGCPFNCIFCVGRKMVGAKVRYRDPLKVVDEFEYLSTLGFHQINIADDLFTANKKHCIDVCDEMLRRGIKSKWTSFARVDTVSPEVLFKMKEAGCTAVSFGVESGVPEILKTIRKGITLDQVIAAVKMCTDADVIPHASFILGLPGETPETIRQTVAFGERIKELGVSHGFHLLAPFPGTLIRDEHEAYGLKILTDDWRDYHANRAIVETDTVTREMFDEIVLKWEKDFDDYLGDVKRRMETGEASEEESMPLVGLERTVLIYELMMNRVIEEKGSWPVDDAATEQDALLTLIDRVSESTDTDLDIVADTMNHTVAKGGLALKLGNGLAQWSWVDYL